MQNSYILMQENTYEDQLVKETVQDTNKRAVKIGGGQIRG